MEGKCVSQSAIVDQVVELQATDLTPHGTYFGGRLLQIVDRLALEVAMRHSGRFCITMGIDSIRYLNPARHGDILLCQASVNKVWGSSMEVGVKMVAEDFRELKRKDIFSAYFTFVAVDEDHQPVEVIPVIPETPEQIKRYHQAEERKSYRS